MPRPAQILNSVDRSGLAEFLRRRREALLPADVGLPDGNRRRTAGLRREEVAGMAGMSTDYYSRLEQSRGPQPSEQMLVAITRALRLSMDERDHLFRLAGHTPPGRLARSDHVSPGLQRVLDRLEDTPAQVTTDLGETLVQNRLAAALLGDQTRFVGLARSQTHRWFTQPASRGIYPARDHDYQSRLQVANLRAARGRDGSDPGADRLVEDLRRRSAEFVELWDRHEVAVKQHQRKTIVHPELGEIELDCQVLYTESRTQLLLVFTATPASESDTKLRLLGVVGSAVTR